MILILTFILSTIVLPSTALAGYPMIEDIPNQKLSMNQSTPVISFNVSDDISPADRLVVTARSLAPDLVSNDGIELGGSGATRTIRVTPIPDRSGTAVIMVIVTDESKEANSDTFQIDFDHPPYGS